MDDVQNKAELSLPTQTSIVEVTDATGRLVDRTSFATQAEADQHADVQRARGFKATVSALAIAPIDE